MPNNVRSDIKIYGNAKDRKALSELMIGDTPFDFNKVIPMPEVLKNTVTGGVTINGKQLKIWREDENKTPIEIPEKYLLQWRLKYGADNWYQWAIMNWGTKWNAYDVDTDHSGSRLHYIIWTAWNDPRNIFDELKDRFPALAFKISVSGEVDEPSKYEL